MEKYRFGYAKHYQRAHIENPKWFSGQIDPEGAEHVAELVRLTGARRLLDYGSGKGYQYLRDRVHERWGGILPHCYDPGVIQLAERPVGQFDGVICTDVAEHIAKLDLPLFFQDLFSMVRSDRSAFVYFNIFCNPAGKSFPSGLNMHLTVKPPEWWRQQLREYERPNLIIRADYEYVRDYDLQSEGLE